MIKPCKLCGVDIEAVSYRKYCTPCSETARKSNQKIDSSEKRLKNKYTRGFWEVMSYEPKNAQERETAIHTVATQNGLIYDDFVVFFNDFYTNVYLKEYI